MRWDEMRESNNVDDQRSRGGGLGVRKLGLGGIAVTVVLGLVMGYSPLQILGLVTGQLAQQPQQQQVKAVTDNPENTLMMKKVLGDTEDVWGKIFQASGQTYQAPTLTLFSAGVRSACGQASSAMGPFYCPADNKVYLDLGFFDELHRKFGAPGDFAQAYVLAHEVGHHIQNLLGTSGKVHQAQQSLSKAEGNALSVKLELQADCYAGVWGHSAKQRGLLDGNDLDEALAAAHAIGDDTLQRNAGRQIVPDSFTHGSSEQRAFWFKRGFESGDPSRCDTFASR